MIYLYVPFNKDENNRNLIKHAKQWYKATYEKFAIPCIVLSAQQQFAIPKTSTEKTKIYILAYEVEEKAGELASSLNSMPCSFLDTETLAERLLKSKLPTKGPVEIKLCIRHNGSNDNLVFGTEAIRKHLLEKNYENPELLIRIQYSAEPFPGEVSKLCYKSIEGSISFFLKNNKKDSVESESVGDLGSCRAHTQS